MQTETNRMLLRSKKGIVDIIFCYIQYIVIIYLTNTIY